MGASTSKATPAKPANPANTAIMRMLLPMKSRASNITINGCVAPIVAATPPGKRYAATNNKTQKIEKFKAPRSAMRPIHTPLGRRRQSSSNINPAGKARSRARVIGYPAGNSSVVTK